MYRNRVSLILAMSLWFAQPAFGLQCSSPTLKAASGVISNKQSYKITGDCTYTWSEIKTGVGSHTTTSDSLSFSYLGSASWDRLTGEAVETLKFTGDSVGVRDARAICSQDPFLKDPPGGPAACGAVKVTAKVESGGIYNLLVQGQFWAAKKLSLAEAQALSNLPPPSQPPPAEKPKVEQAVAGNSPGGTTVGGVASTGAGSTGTASTRSPPQDVAGRAAVIEQMQRGSGAASRQPMDARRVAQPAAESPQRAARVTGPATQMEIEGESFVTSGATTVNGGQARVQQMAGFGSGWSGGAQLFWSGGATGAVLDLFVDVPAASKYAVEIYMTRAPDYGQLQFEIDGNKSTVPFDGMAPQVMTSGPVQLGTFALQAGKRQLSLMITGKHAQATGYYVGIDKLRLYPAGPID
ncbi:MAG: hypothetical protein KDI87_10010 [Gammaproteobacteria bacterium]|nr:hypothetical protein [Gammaproteobacteria bacterium]MCP5139076.1 hypothetical protein [Chromatiales bacterium]